jgi:hypothetical protein
MLLSKTCYVLVVTLLTLIALETTCMLGAGALLLNDGRITAG